ncbi:toxin [Desulfonatronum parangueonense]
MKYFDWVPVKNETLKTDRGLSFEEIVLCIEMGGLLGIEEHPVRPNQKIYIVEMDGYAVIVPFVEDSRKIFLKTAFPSRNFTKKYGLQVKE